MRGTEIARGGGGEAMLIRLRLLLHPSLQFLAVSQRSFFKRGERLKFKSEPLCRSDNWVGPSVRLPLDAATHEVSGHLHRAYPPAHHGTCCIIRVRPRHNGDTGSPQVGHAAQTVCTGMTCLCHARFLSLRFPSPSPWACVGTCK